MPERAHVVGLPPNISMRPSKSSPTVLTPIDPSGANLNSADTWASYFIWLALVSDIKIVAIRVLFI